MEGLIGARGEAGGDSAAEGGGLIPPKGTCVVE